MSGPERVVAIHDEASGARAFLVLDSTRRGPAFGGVRRARYADLDAARTDALRLAEAMTWKTALADLPAGGGKTVLVDHDGLDLPAAYRAIGRAVAALAGAYVCGPDVGTGSAELGHVRLETTHVNPEGNDAAAATARGVLAGLRGLLAVLDGDERMGDRRYVVQGLGAVGLALARALVAAGGTVTGADRDPAAARAAEAVGVRVVHPERILDEQGDVLLPCALGGVLDEDAARRLRVRGICGSANNPLAGRGGAILHERGILLAPDVVVSAGAVIEGVLTVREGAHADARARAAACIEGIADRCADVLREARARDVPPTDVAIARARALVARVA